MQLLHPEYQYLSVLQNIMENGKLHENRTGVKTKRLLCEIMKFDMSEGQFPLLTTKKVYWKGIVYELLWFLSGSSNISFLEDNGVGIWTANAKDHFNKLKTEYDLLTSAEERDRFGLCHPFFDPDDYRELGPVYGYQWRKFNADASGQGGIDQISWALNEIAKNPQSRRIIVSAWNPLQIPHMALPPCHVFFQFTVDSDLLHCTMYQRSCDMFLGVPFNIASYALLTCMVAHCCGLKPGTLNHILNDAHIYENHFDAVKEQLSRAPLAWPKLEINQNKNNLFSLKYDDIKVVDYVSLPAIKADMAV